MKISSQNVAALLKERNQILLLTHKRPDGDTIGSAAALCLALRELNKTVYVAENPEVTDRYQPFLQDLIAPHSFQPQCIISVDIASESLIPDSLLCYLDQIEMVLDHHPNNNISCQYSCVDSHFAACGEMIYEIIVKLGVSLSQRIAEEIYLAISTDTGCFLYSNTTENTHFVASQCMKTGISIENINREMFLIKSKARLEVESILISRMRYHCQGKIALCILTREDILKTAVTEDDLESIATLPRTVSGVDIGIYIKEMPDGCKISVRTGQSSAPAVVSSLGGGGHLRAAGAYYYGPSEKAAELLLEAAERELGQHGN